MKAYGDICKCNVSRLNIGSRRW